MKTLDVANQRMNNQRLSGVPFAHPEEVVGWLCAVQAQDYGAAKWGVAQRTTGATNEDFDRLFDAGAVLRTHVLRPTWHFVTPADIRWMLGLTAPRVHAANSYYYRKLELDDAVFRTGNELLTTALQGGKQLTRAELAGGLRHGGIDASGLRLSYLLMHAELDALICSGALRGKQFTYALMDERVPPASPYRRVEAIAELTRRYFASHGPATVHDFAWWSGLTVTDAKSGIELAKPHLVREVSGETTYWFTPVPTTPMQRPAARLLPNYDEYLIAYKDHSASFAEKVYRSLKPDEGALIGHIIVVDGLVVGGWRRTLDRRGLTIETDLLVPLSPAETDAVRVAAEDYGRFFGLPVAVGFATAHRS
jgi:hypothetical protein